MKTAKRSSKWKFFLLAIWSAILLVGSGGKVHAEGSMFDSKYVVPYTYVDPEGVEKKFFTIRQPQPVDTNRETVYKYHTQMDYVDPRTGRMGEGPSFWIDEDTKIVTGIASKLPELKTGEHYYKAERLGEIPIGYWRCAHRQGKCIHDGNEIEQWKGLNIGSHICYGLYYSGWLPYCADCGQQLGTALIYSPPDILETIDYYNVDYGYYYICPNPNCKHLENEGYGVPHKCKAVSPNRYKVVYDANGEVPVEEDYADILGDMMDSYHMYDNATEFEGMPMEPVTHLTKCSYRKDAYTFTGWNTKPDGSGESFADGQEILNLSKYNYLDENNKIDPRGVVTLYAQWVPTVSTLEIDPNGGSYDGKTGITSVTQGYGQKYLADPEKVNPASIHQVAFDTRGGNSITPMQVPRQFTCWRQQDPFKGKMKENTYYFTAPNGNVDRLTAVYENQSIVLPTPKKDGYQFGGWFEDPACEKKPAGFGGDSYLARDNVTLYARWSELVLWSYDNYKANNKKGAVNLKWQQNDSYVKSYKLYMSSTGPELSSFQEIEGTSGAEVVNVGMLFNYNGTRQTYMIPSTGFYDVAAFGAQGGSYGTKIGGPGGMARGKFYLTKGDTLTVTVGGQNGWGGGGEGSAYAPGGGATIVKSEKLGILLIGGGGGGATEFSDGGCGGLETGLRADADTRGENGGAGGGAGAVGGKAGNVIRHFHTESCLAAHVHGPECYVETKHDHDEEICPYHYDDYCGGWHIDPLTGESYRGWCPNCGRDESGGCNNAYGPGKCVHIRVWTCGQDGKTVKTLVCTKTTEPIYTCGYTDGEILSTTTAYGGSNYINPAAVWSESSGNARLKNGAASIQAVGIGMTNDTQLQGVPANDLAAPDAVSEQTIRKEAVSDHIVNIYWEEPKDNGTKYWFRAESYRADGKSDKKLCDSNITSNTLTTGIDGYYFRYNQNPHDTVTADNAALVFGKKEPLKMRVIQCTMSEVYHYLHIAPVDVAGNVGPTVTIKIDKIGTGEDQILWPVITKQVQASVLRAGDDNLYTAPSGKIYVRADGRTPVRLSFESYMNGMATEDYQITEQEFYVNRNTPGTAYRFRTVLPKSENISKADMQTLPVREFQRYGSGSEKILLDASNSGAYRGMMGTKNVFFQFFMIPESESGKVLVVTPGAGAGDVEAEEEDIHMHSAWEKDILNAVYLYPDGEAPSVTANQDFDSLTVINIDTIADRTITFTAADALSGLREMSVRIVNQDSSLTQTIKDTDKDGVIALTVDETSVLFDGDVSFEVTAIDNVGNRNVRTFGKAEYTMEAEIVHSGYHPSGEADFRRGDPAVLHVETTGFADTIRIEVPDEIKPGYPEDQKEFYGLRDYRTVRYINFDVPEDCAPGNYTFVVHSYKNGVQLEARPVMLTVLDGPVSLEVHVRIR